MDEYGGGGGGGVGTILMLLVGAVCSIGLYVFWCFMLKKICEKVGRDPGMFIWIPVLQLLPLLEVAGLPTWHILLFLVPFYAFYFWWKVAEARGKPGFWGILVALPCTMVIGLPYLAFSE